MTVFLHGRFVPEAEATVSVFDRSFLLGDGLFETVRVYGGKPFRWSPHLERLRAGAAFTGIRIPFTDTELGVAASELIRRNALPESLLRLHLSRGVGPRGYSPKGADSPLMIMTLHPAAAHDPANPFRWSLVTSSFRIPAGDRLAAFKSASKLPQILAKAEAEARGADEAVLLNTEDRVAEAASSNLFWIEHGAVRTPPLAEGLLAGVTRAFVLELAHELGLKPAERPVSVSELAQMEGVFLTVSSLGIVPAIRLDDTPLHQSPITQRLQEAYQAAVTARPLS